MDRMVPVAFLFIGKVCVFHAWNGDQLMTCSL